ncbi:MAG TPA: Vms1/Ankzf1 family peptidyl-tRNA hydrolase [Candidatus Nitrosotenuis sp.]|nr:Vms1/Ankzf1 family peptidyl-tRNA hydrolase [Candidatus Nitrosotenuis sp.]
MRNTGQRPSMVDPAEWYSINKFMLSLDSQNPPYVSVYDPRGKDLEAVNILQETKRNEITEKIEHAVEKRIINLDKSTNAKKRFIAMHCVFGWQDNGRIVVRNIGISKRLPFVYVVSKKPFLKPIYDILQTNYRIILVILDHKSMYMRYMHGNKTLIEKRKSINLQGRHKKGGQSQKRFLRARQTFIQGFFKKVQGEIQSLYSKDVDILFLGGSGMAKTEFYGTLVGDLKDKCRIIRDVDFGTSANELDKKIIRSFYEYRKKYVLGITSKFDKLVKTGLVVIKNADIAKALTISAVDTLLISANYYHSSSASKKIMGMIEIAENASSKIEFVTNPRLVAKLARYGHVVALLRYGLK